MASYVTPKKNSAFIFYVGLTSTANRPAFQTNPTLAAGDVKVSTDGGATANAATLPDVEPDAGVAVRVQLSASEMNGDNVVVLFQDAAGAQWDDLLVNIQTSTAQIDDIKTDTAATLADTGLDGVVVAAASKTGYALSAAGIDSIIDEVTEGTLTLREAINIMLAALSGVSAGGGTTSITFQDKANSKARITATVDSNGNRTAVTLDGS